MSKWTIITLSLLSAIVGGMMVGAVLLFFTVKSETYQSLKPDKYGAGTGYKMLADFQCRYGQTKHILMNGVDDNFALGDLEPSRRNPLLSHLPGLWINHPYKRDYDQIGQDKVLVDYFKIPPKVVKGLFVTRVEHFDNYGNDRITLGDIDAGRDDFSSHSLYTFNARLNDLHKVNGWTRTPGQVYFSRLEDIKFQWPTPSKEKSLQWKYATLLQFLQNQEGEIVIDVGVTDDTGVDFTGLALCTEPEEKRGVTFTENKEFSKHLNGLQLMGCDQEPTAIQCNPIYGDTLCTDTLPLACIIETGHPTPVIAEGLPEHVKVEAQKYWGVGDVDFTPVVRGDQFKILSEANQFCAQTFGAGWRVLDYHDGGLKGVTSYRAAHVPNSRVWVDIKDQPNGTCWARDDAAIPEQKAQQ